MELDPQVQKDLASFRVHPYRSKRLKPYYRRMSKDDNHVLVDDHVKAVLEAQGFHWEENPRSIYSVEKLFKALAAYAPDKSPNVIVDKDYINGVNLAYACFGCRNSQKLHMLPMTPETVVLVTSNPQGSPGLTNYGVTKAASATRALERGIQTLRGVKAPEPCLAFKRTQFNGKTRLVWGYPYSMTVIEGLIAKPLLDRFKSGTTPMAFAKTSGALGASLRVASYHKEFAYSLDMSSFDSTISPKLIKVAFGIIASWFNLDEVEPVTGLSFLEILSIIQQYFIKTPIVMPDGNIYKGKRHGVPSGSFFTQLIDSIVNVIIGGAIASRFALHVSRKDIFVLGDDMLFWSNRKVDLDGIAHYANTHFGVKLHGSEKSAIFHFDEPIHFLGRIWENGLPNLDEQGIVQRMVYPERFRKYSKNPDVREKQVKMLILSFAANYRHGWKIAYSLLEPSNSNLARGCANIDVNVYARGCDPGDFDPDMLSGLQRYILKYHASPDKADIPITAMQYWL